MNRLTFNETNLLPLQTNAGPYQRDTVPSSLRLSQVIQHLFEEKRKEIVSAGWRSFLSLHSGAEQAAVWGFRLRHRSGGLSQSYPMSVLCHRPSINRPPVQQVSLRGRRTRGQRRGNKLPNSPSYLVDILRYTVHLVGPGHPCWSVSQNHRPRFPLGEAEMVCPNCDGRKSTAAGGDRGSCLRWRRETSSSGRGIPAFIGKSSAAPTPAPHAATQSVALGWSAEADSLLQGRCCLHWRWEEEHLRILRKSWEKKKKKENFNILFNEQLVKICFTYFKEDNKGLWIWL